MNIFSRQEKNFFSDRPAYAGRLQLVGVVFMSGMITFELLLAEWGGYYPTHWFITVGFVAAALCLIVLIGRYEFPKKQMATVATIMSLCGTGFLTARVVEASFTPLVQAQLLFGLVFMSLVFERKKFLVGYLIGVTAIFCFTIPYLDFFNERHLFFLLILLFVYLFYFLSFRFKMGWINILRFSEGVLSTYDRYVIVFNEKGDAIYASPFIMKQLGINPADVRKKDWWELRNIDETKVREYKEIIAGRVAENAEIPLYRQSIEVKNGDKRTIEWNAQIVNGKYYIGHGTDITEELNAKREAEKLSKVSQALGAGVAIANYKGELTWCNSSYCSIFGYDLEELIGRKPSEIFKVPEFFRAWHKKNREGGIDRGEQLEIPHYRKDGRLIWVLVQTSEFAEDRQKRSDTIEVVTDITSQKNSELEVKQISLIAERTQTPVLVCDEEFTVNWINSALLSEFGFEFEEIIGSDFLSLYNGERTSDGPVELLIDSLKNKLSCQTDILLKGKGQSQWYKLSMDPIKNEYGNIEQFMVIMQNIQKLKDAQQLIEQKNRNMIASISYAKRIQSALLPDADVLENQLPQHFFYYQPKDIVSGDFYFAKMFGDRLYIAVADCTGHGVPGAMISSIGAAALNNAIFDKECTEPGEILDHADRYLKKTLSASEESFTDGMDLGIVVLDFNENELHYAGARRPLVIVNNERDELVCIRGNKRSIGEFIKELDEQPFTTHTIPVNDDIMIYMFTDGMTDQFGGESHKKLRFNPFLKLVKQCAESDISEQFSLFEEFYREWTHDHKIEQTDDMLLFAASLSPVYMRKMESKNKYSTTYDN